MSPVRSSEASSLESERCRLADGLTARRDEIEKAALVRVNALSPPSLVADPHYLDALRTAVGGAIDYGLASIRQGESNPPAVPALLLSQAELAARSRIPLDTVLRRYFAGFTLFSSFVFDEAERGGIKPSTLRNLMREQSLLFDRFIEGITTAYTDEEERMQGDTADGKSAERLQRLLDGELVDTSEFDYDFTAHHVALVGAGDNAEGAIRHLAVELDRRLLIVRPAEEIVWAWLGGRREIAAHKLQMITTAPLLRGVPVAIGERAIGLSGWRLTHRQAKVALPVALRIGEPVRHSRVALLATLLQDELLAASLRDSYLVPLEADRDRGVTARRTLRAYFAAERNMSSAASVLKVSRRTVANRLRSVEERLGQPLSSIGAEIEIALRFEALEADDFKAGQ